MNEFKKQSGQEKMLLVDQLRTLKNLSYQDAKLILEKANWDIKVAEIALGEKKKPSMKYNNKFVEDKISELKNIFNNIIMDSSIDDEKKINLIIHSTSLVCAIIAIQPIPFADVFILTPVQVVMVTYLNKVIGNPFKKSNVNEIVTYLMGVVGWGVLAQQVILGAYKTVIPFLGALTTIPLVYAATYALGIGAKTVLKSQLNNEEYDKDELKRIIKEAKLNAKKEATFDFTIKSLKNELDKVRNQSLEYSKYKERLSEVETLLSNERNNRAESELPSNNIIEQYEKQVQFLKNRFRKSYGKRLQVNESFFYTLTLFPAEAIKNVEHNLSQLIQGHFYKINLSNEIEKEFELSIKDAGRCYLYRKNDVYILNYIEVDEKLSDRYPLIQMTNGQKHKHLKNEEIRRYFEKAINESKKELLIISPWITENILINLYTYFDQAVARGVKIKIIFGYSGDRLVDSKKAAELLKSKYKNKIELIQQNTHYKLVISDDNFYILGSLNFLSFGGNYSYKGTRNEGAIYCNSVSEVKTLKEMYF